MNTNEQTIFWEKVHLKNEADVNGLQTETKNLLKHHKGTIQQLTEKQ